MPDTILVSSGVGLTCAVGLCAKLLQKPVKSVPKKYLCCSHETVRIRLLLRQAKGAFGRNEFSIHGMGNSTCLLSCSDIASRPLVAGGNARMHFVDDRFDTVQAILEAPELKNTNLKVYLADW